MPVATHSPEQTESAAEKIAGALAAGDVLALTGDLGAGKTHFSRGIARGLAVADAGAVSSPTFSIVQHYPGGRLPLFHFDFYRIGSASEIVALGWDDYLDAGGVTIVEWADKFPELLPASTRWWAIGHTGAETRTITETTTPPCAT